VVPGSEPYVPSLLGNIHREQSTTVPSCVSPRLTGSPTVLFTRVTLVPLICPRGFCLGPTLERQPPLAEKLMTPPRLRSPE
jgi:hypothetical protein